MVYVAVHVVIQAIFMAKIGWTVRPRVQIPGPPTLSDHNFPCLNRTHFRSLGLPAVQYRATDNRTHQGALGGQLLEAKLVSFGVGQHNPAAWGQLAPVVNNRCTQLQQPFKLSVLISLGRYEV
jgi:hypothetical protein